MDNLSADVKVKTQREYDILMKDLYRRNFKWAGGERPIDFNGFEPVASSLYDCSVLVVRIDNRRSELTCGVTQDEDYYYNDTDGLLEYLNNKNNILTN